MTKKIQDGFDHNEKTFEEVTKDEAPAVVASPRVYPNSVKGEKRASGHCDSCGKRYNDVPVIDNVPQCPKCTKI